MIRLTAAVCAGATSCATAGVTHTMANMEAARMRPLTMGFMEGSLCVSANRREAVGSCRAGCTSPHAVGRNSHSARTVVEFRYSLAWRAMAYCAVGVLG